MDTWQNIKRFFADAPLVACVGLAAFPHSTWSWAVMFNGNIPDVQTDVIGFALALVPALLLSFAVDVGLISVAHAVRDGRRDAWNLTAFAILALTTFYLQWLYLVHHIEVRPLGSGVPQSWVPLVTLIRNASVFVLPAFLPIATTFYTFSGSASMRKRAAPRSVGVSSGVSTGELADWVWENADETWTGECRYENCDASYIKPTQISARNALTAHLRTHKRKAVASTNGSKR